MFHLGLDSRSLRFVALCLGALGPACGDDSAAGGSSVGSTTGATDSSSTTGTTAGTDVLDDTGTSEGGSSEDGEPVVCPETHQCVPIPPEGWEGPVAFVETAVDDDEPECDGAFAEPATVAYQGLIAPPAECSCACGEATDISCPLSLIARFWGEDSTCSEGTPAQYEFFTTVCNLLPSTLPANTYWTAQPVQASGGSCEAIADMILDPARFEKRVTACGGADLLEGCASTHVCSPIPDAPFSGGTCIWQAGDHECPAGYSDRQTLFTDIADDRACLECECADPVGLCDQASFTLLNQPCNAPVAGNITANGQCQGTGNSQSSSAVVSSGEPTAFCSASEAMAVGAAQPSDPVTLCCQ